MPLQKHVGLLILIPVSARIPNKERKMAILSWLLKRYFSTRNSNEADLCINKCKYAVLGNYNKYYCFVKKHELRRNSTVYGCSYYTIKGEKRDGILCPNCQSDLIERTHDHRFKCAVCGNIFS